VRADKNSSSAGGSEEPDAGQRRFREELQRIPMVSHEVYGSCLAPAYPSQLLIALGQLASLPIGAWRGQAGADSRNAFVALWFACRWEPAKDGVLIGFELGDNAVHLDTALLQQEIDDLPAMAAGRLLWWQPRGISPRISAQQAAFVFGRVVDEPWGSIRLAQGQVSLGNIGAVPGAAVVFVSARLKAALNGIWGPLLGFSEESLFPDFDGFALAHGVDKPFPAEFNIDS
jgi:hypothetical protein